jgi:hypothetical protein
VPLELGDHHVGDPVALLPLTFNEVYQSKAAKSAGSSLAKEEAKLGSSAEANENST